MREKKGRVRRAAMREAGPTQPGWAEGGVRLGQNQESEGREREQVSSLFLSLFFSPISQKQTKKNVLYIYQKRKQWQK